MTLIGANGQPVRIMHLRGKNVEIDSEIYELVYALNAHGVETVASCSGHGLRPGNIALKDGREFLIMSSYEEARHAEKRRKALEEVALAAQRVRMDHGASMEMDNPKSESKVKLSRAIIDLIATGFFLEKRRKLEEVPK